MLEEFLNNPNELRKTVETRELVSICNWHPKISCVGSSQVKQRIELSPLAVFLRFSVQSAEMHGKTIFLRDSSHDEISNCGTPV